jgi:hypothetical protein
MPTKNGAALRSESTAKRSESTVKRSESTAKRSESTAKRSEDAASSYLEMRQRDQEIASKDMLQEEEEKEEEEKEEGTSPDYIQLVDRYLGKRSANFYCVCKNNKF